MRDVLLVTLFAGILPFAIRHTWVGVLLWTWLSLMNPHRLTFGFANDFPFAAIAAVATLASLLWNTDKWRVPRDATVWLLVLFVVWMCVTTALAIDPNSSLPALDRAAKIQLMTLVALLSIRERKHIELFVWINVLSIGFYGVKGGLFALATGGSYRVWGPVGSFVEDNNALGLALVMIIPLGYYLWQRARQRWLKWGLAVFLLLNAVGALSTQSRGTFLGIVAMSLVLWTRARNKWFGAAVMLASAVLLVSFMPDTWSDRMRTIGSYEEDSSAMQRLNAWQTAVNIANNRVTGAGFAVATPEIFARYSPKPEWIVTAHSIYFQPLGEHGWIGLALFLSLGALSFWNARRIRRDAAQHAETQWAHDLAGMVQVSMIGYAVAGAFLSLSYWDLPYNFIIMLIAMKYWLIEERCKHEKAGALGATSSLTKESAQAPVSGHRARAS